MRLYGVDGEETRDVGPLNAFFLIPDRPEVFNLPPKPVLPSTFQPAAYTAALLAAAALTRCSARACSAAPETPRSADLAAARREATRAAGNFSPDAVAASMQRGDGGFGRDQETYFDHPVLRKAHWRWEIIAYFFAGGPRRRARRLRRSRRAAAIPTTRSWCATAATRRSSARHQRRAAGQGSRPPRTLSEHAAHPQAQVADVGRRGRSGGSRSTRASRRSSRRETASSPINRSRWSRRPVCARHRARRRPR